MEPQKDDRRSMIALATIMVLAGMCLCPIGLVQLMAEGPHGPNGEITGDPTNNIRALALCIPSFVLMGWGIALGNRLKK